MFCINVPVVSLAMFLLGNKKVLEVKSTMPWDSDSMYYTSLEKNSGQSGYSKYHREYFKGMYPVVINAARIESF